MAEALTSKRDMVAEIISYLPAKEIHRLHCLCKSFNFADALLCQMQTTRRRGKVDGLISSRWTDDRDFCFFPEDGESNISNVGVPKGTIERGKTIHGKNLRVIGSSNGLVVLEEKPCNGEDRNPSLYAYNPVNHAFFTIPRPTYTAPWHISYPHNIGIVAHIFSPGSWELLLIAVDDEWGEISYLRCWVYSSRDRSWGTLVKIPCGPRNLNLSRAVSIHRKVYIASDCSSAWTLDPYILEIDVDAMTSRLLPMPVEPLRGNSDRLEIGTWGERGVLCLVCWSPEKSSFFIWEMEDEDPRNWTWRKTCIHADLRTLRVDVKNRRSETSPRRRKERIRRRSYLLEESQRHHRNSRWWLLQRDLRKHGVRDFTVVDGKKLVFMIGDWMHTWSIAEDRLMRAQFRPWSSCGYLPMYPYSNTLIRLD